MIIGTVQSTEVSEVASTVDALVKMHAVQAADTRESFDRAARSWLVEHHPGCSGGFADIVLAKAWVQHTTRTARLEVTASELAQLAELLGAAPATVAVEALSAKVADAAARMGLQSTAVQEDRPEATE